MCCTLCCRGLSSNLEFSLKARCTPCSLYLLDFVLNSCGVFPTTEAYPLVFNYMQGVFFAFRMSVGLCPQTMWCTPHYRGLSSCFSFMCRVYSLQFIFLLDFVLRWCTPLYRGISSILNLCGQFMRRLLASTLSLTGFPCPIDL